jgi:hypothetical protein
MQPAELCEKLVLSHKDPSRIERGRWLVVATIKQLQLIYTLYNEVYNNLYNDLHLSFLDLFRSCLRRGIV